MANFIKVTKRINSNCFGTVVGSNWTSDRYPVAYIGFAEVGKILFGLLPKVDRKKLMLYGVGFDDYIFGKDDIEKAEMIGERASFRLGNQTVSGPKYKFEFKDGKAAIITVGRNDAYKLDSVLY